MRIGAFGKLDEHGNYLRFLKQYGIEDVVLSSNTHPDSARRFSPENADKAGAHWDFLDFVLVRKHCEDAGMRLVAIENPVPPWCYERVMLGLPGRDQQIENLTITIRNMGRAGIPVFGYHWMVNQPGATRNSWRTSLTTPGRGGSQISSFDMEIAKDSPLFRDREYTEEEMWENYEYFIKAIVPVAEEAGVKLAVHPDDPPVDKLGGIPRLFHDFDGFQRAMQIADSPASGLNLCLGNWTAMGTDILAAIRHFGERGQIIYGHAQGVQGTVPSFRECFLDEADCDFLAVLRALKEVGFDSVLLPGHFPHTLYENDQGGQGLTYAIGYMKGLLQTVNASDV
jgi:mannonate dehydratase